MVCIFYPPNRVYFCHTTQYTTYLCTITHIYRERKKEKNSRLPARATVATYMAIGSRADPGLPVKAIVATYMAIGSRVNPANRSYNDSI